MSSTSPPMGSDTPAGPALSDERALERVFRAHFSVLAEEAKVELGDAASSAPRVVEAAFRHAWEDRARLQTSAELDAFLRDAVHHGAAREKSRRASLHRPHEGKAAAHAAPPVVIDVDKSWAHLIHALHGGSEGGVAAQMSADAVRHDAAGHVAELAKGRSWKVPIAIGVAGAAVVLFGLWYVDRLGEEGAVTNALAASDARVHPSLTGQMAIVTLDDGTKVTLAPESKLIVPKLFGDNLRAVKIDGAATFEVAPGRKTPFEVRAGKAAIIATGTVITVRAYATDDAVIAFVKEGTASVKVGDATKAVASGQAVLVDKNATVRIPSPDELNEAISWNDRKLTIADRQLRFVLPQLQRWYGLDIKVPDLPLLDRTVSFQASLDSPREAISAVEKSAGVKFGYIDKTMVFRDARGTPPKKKG
jgi:ferric-dicitrate binding protein FerR (iron transport regulator)